MADPVDVPVGESGGAGLAAALGGARTVLVAGAGVTGAAVVRALSRLGRTVLLADRSTGPAVAALAALPGVTAVGDATVVPSGVDLVVVSPGIRPDAPLVVDAQRRGVPVIGEVELAWRLDRSRPDGGREWLVVTGTNGKTTTTGMLQSILRAAGRTVTACGNIGWPVTEAVLATEPEQDVLAVELSSFQLHSAPGLRPRAGVLLNLAEDHLDWYGLRPADPVDPAEPVRDPDLLARDRAAATAAAMAAYGSDKARALAGEVAVAVVDDPAAADLLSRSPAARRIGITAGVPGPGQLGVVDGVLVDRAFAPTTGESAELLTVAEVRPPGPHNVTNALAAAALAAAVGVPPEAIGRGLRDFTPGGHRNELVAVVRTAAGDIPFVDDSKATNPHAAAASLLARPRVVWIAGGQLKGASVDELVLAVADRLDGVVLLGVDGPVVAAALSRHAPDVPLVAVTDTDDGAMEKVVGAAARLARPGAAVVLAPAAASLDMYASYADRGRAFAAAVRRLGADGTAR